MEKEIEKIKQGNTNILVVGNVDKENVILGDADSFVRFSQNVPMQAILWNEEYLIAKTPDRGTIVAYKPEIEPTTKMFFSREERRGSYSSGGRDNMLVWEGEYNPVEFTKGNLIKFIKQHSHQGTDELLNTVKNMKVIEKRIENSELIDLGTGDFDDQNIRTVEEETAVTNIPSKFSLKMPLFSNYSAEFQFEAKVVRSDDGYGNPNKGKKVIQLRVLNAREVMRGVMYDILKKLPEEVPKYYGKLSLSNKRRDEY